MKELKLRTVGEEFNINVKDKIMVKPFYTLQEKRYVIDDMKDSIELIDKDGQSKIIKKDALYREYTKVVDTVRVCTNLDVDGLSGDEIYDLASSLGLPFQFTLEIDGYSEIDELIQQDESVYNALDALVDVIGENLKSFDMKDLQKTLIDLGGVANNGGKQLGTISNISKR